MTRHGLLIVDVQNDFCEGGALAVAGGNAVAASVSALLREHAADPEVSPFDVIIATQDWHIDPGTHWSDDPDFVDTWPIHCRAESPGAALHPELATTITELGLSIPLVRKGEFEAAYSGFEGATAEGTKIVDLLRSAGIESATVVGIAFDHCVKQTALDAASEGFSVTVRKALTASVSPERDEQNIADLKAAGVNVE